MLNLKDLEEPESGLFMMFLYQLEVNYNYRVIVGGLSGENSKERCRFRVVTGSSDKV